MIWQSVLLRRLVNALGNIPKLKRIVRRILLNLVASSSERRKNTSRHKLGGVLEAFFLITKKWGVVNNRHPASNLPASDAIVVSVHRSTRFDTNRIDANPLRPHLAGERAAGIM